MNYYRVQVALAHLGTGSTEYECWHVTTDAMAGDVLSNRGKMLPGIKRVTQVETITEAQYNAAWRGGRKAFEVQAR